MLGGYNVQSGVLASVERFSLIKHVWESLEPMFTPRMNCSSCILEEKYVYVFGGIGNMDYLSSIERFNTELNIWNEINVRMPVKLSNSFTCAINK